MIRTVLQALRKSAAPNEQGLVDSGLAQPPIAPEWAPAPAPAGPRDAAVYWPGIFEANSLDNAKAIALTPEKDQSTDERWQVETDFTIDLIASRLQINEKHRVLDFGCGAGRMSRALIRRFGCSVVGVDQARKMREYAVGYVDSPRFRVFSPEEFDAQVADGLYVDFGLACWALQHCMYPAQQVGRIANALAADAPFLLINSVLRLIPTNQGWRSDGEDLDACMGVRFDKLEQLAFPPGVAAEDVINSSSISWWQRKV
jgi:SAM-dependent methyltransferase